MLAAFFALKQKQTEFVSFPSQVYGISAESDRARPSFSTELFVDVWDFAILIF